MDLHAAQLCAGMCTHRASLDVQRASAAALHCLAERAAVLAHAAVGHDAVRLLAKAMSTYRADGACRLQAPCGYLAVIA